MSRWRYLAKRLLMSIPVVWLGTSMTWFAIYMGPIDPAAYVISQADAQKAGAVKNARKELGLNKPPLEHYVGYMWDLLTFDLGSTMLVYQGSPVYALIVDFAPRTLWLGFWSVLIAVGIGLPIGFYAGLRDNTFADYIASFGGIVWRAMPNFWLAVMLLTILVQSEKFLMFDWDTFLVNVGGVTGNPNLSNLTDPTNFLQATKKIFPAALVLGSASMGNEVRIARTAVLETRNEPYVDFAKARGVSGRLIVWKHILRNALIPLVPVITSEMFLLIGGSVLVETVFGIQGIGSLFFEAARQGDLPLVGTLMYVFILFIVGINLIQDFLYTLIDPRVGYEET